MKKGIIVLLVAVLALGSAFAVTMTGSANLDFGYNFKTTEWGFDNGKSAKTSFTFELASDKADFGSKGEGDLYAEIAAEFSVTLSSSVAPTKTWIDTGSSWYYIEASNLTDGSIPTFGGKWVAKITKANIIYKDLTIGILNAGGGKDYAKTYYYEKSDSSNHKYVQESIVKMGSKLADGFTFDYAKKVNGGFGANGNVNNGTYNVFAHAELTAIENFKAYAWTNLKETAKVLGAGATYTYAADELSATAAADVKYTVDGDAEIEFAANANYDFLTFDAYYLTKDTFNTNKLDAKVAATFDDGVVAGAYVDVRDIISKAQDITLNVDFNEGIVITNAWVETIVDGSLLAAGIEGAVDAVTFGCSYTTNYEFNDHIIAASAKYKADKFTASIGTGSDGIEFTDKLVHASVKASVESDAIIDNCTLRIAYTGADFAKNATDEIINAGAITASATIKF